MGIYDFMLELLLAKPEIIPADKAHWQKVHAENLKTDRRDMIIFSAKMLATIAAAEHEMAIRA